MRRDFMNLPDAALLRLTEVLNLIPVCRATWYWGMRRGVYPRPVQIGMRAVAWRVSDIRKLLERRPAEHRSGGGRQCDLK